MSRIGNRILTIPAGVTVTTEGNVVSVKGPKGELSTEIDKHLKVEVNGTEVKITRESDLYKKFHGTANANIKNMIIGVTEGYEKKLEAVGVGYRFALKGKDLDISAGFSHHVDMITPEGITLECPSNTELVVKGIDKQKVGQFAAEIRAVREPEPYKGKGIRYTDEYIIRKVGKKASK
ncbi:MAG: 50S ribosomal protein L6 [Bacilli bacterium]|nr:50S ribosomal protein L6 [Bacilli bacterium]